jgi:hypothetical protein
MPSTRSLVHGSNAVDNTSEELPANNTARARPTRQHTAGRNRARNAPQTVGDITLPELNLVGLSSTEEDTDDASVTQVAVASRNLSQQPRQPRLVRQPMRRPIRATSPADRRSLRTMAPTATSRGDMSGAVHPRPRQRQTQPPSSLGQAGSSRKHDAEETDFMNRQADGTFLLGLHTNDGIGPGTLGRSLGLGASAGVSGMPWVQQEQEEFVKAQQEEEEEGTCRMHFRVGEGQCEIVRVWLRL